jgi:hypothetical protein
MARCNGIGPQALIHRKTLGLTNKPAIHATALVIRAKAGVQDAGGQP